jgi:single-strand DNA-binding protein
MNDTITLAGLVATAPRQQAVSGNVPVTSFRLVSFQGHFDRAKDTWIDDDPNFYTISAFRQLATNVLGSVEKGDRVIVTGRVRIRDWEASGRSGTNIDVNANSIGHDLNFGRTSYSPVAASPATKSDWPEDSGADAPVAEGAAAGEPGTTPQQRQIPEPEQASAAAQPDDVTAPF